MLIVIPSSGLFYLEIILLLLKVGKVEEMLFALDTVILCNLVATKFTFFFNFVF